MINPSGIAYGISSADRETLATLLSLFEESSLPTLLFDSAKDLIRKISDYLDSASNNENDKFKKSFEERIAQKKQLIINEKVSDNNLRLRLWMQLTSAFQLDPDLTFSNTGINAICDPLEKPIIEIACDMAEKEEISNLSFFSSDYWKKRTNQIKIQFAKNKEIKLTLADVINRNVFRLLLEAEKTDDLPPEIKVQILAKVKQKIAGADPELQKAFLKGGNVDDLTETAALQLLAGSGSLIGIGLAVELAGFSAYILAAQASAVIPLVGGQTLVSSLAVLANPLFIIPVLLGGGILISGSVKRKIFGAFGVSAVTILILRAIGDKKQNADELIDAFKNLPNHLDGRLLYEYRKDSLKTKTNTFTDKITVFFLSTRGWVKKQLVNDQFPNVFEYLNRYYELKG